MASAARAECTFGIKRFCHTDSRISLGAKLFGDSGNRAHLFNGQSADGHGHANVVQIRLELRMDTNVAGSIDCIARLALSGIDPKERKCQAILGFSDEFLHAPTINEVLQACFLAIGPVAVIHKDADHRSRYRNGLVRRCQQPCVLRKLPVPGDAAQKNTKVDAGRNAGSLADTHGLETDIVGICQHADRTTAVKRNVKLARQFV